MATIGRGNWGRNLVGVAIALSIVAGITIFAVRWQNRENERLKAFSEQMRVKLTQRDEYLARLAQVDLNYEARGRLPLSPSKGVDVLKIPYPTAEQMEERLGKADKREDLPSILRLTWMLGDLAFDSIRDPAAYTQADFAKEDGAFRLRRLRMVEYSGDKVRRAYVTVIGRTGAEWSSSETTTKQNEVH